MELSALRYRHSLGKLATLHRCMADGPNVSRSAQPSGRFANLRSFVVTHFVALPQQTVVVSVSTISPNEYVYMLFYTNRIMAMFICPFACFFFKLLAELLLNL